MRLLLLIIILNSLVVIVLSAQSSDYALNGGGAPTTFPQKYGEGILYSDSLKLSGISFSPGGNELIYVIKEQGLFYMKKNGGIWTDPELLEISDQFKTHIMYPKFSPNGRFISFVDGNAKEYGFGDIYKIERLADGTWSDTIIKLPEPLNSNKREAGHSFTLDGTLYFSSGRADDTWSGNILKAKPVEGGGYEISVISELSMFSIETDEECLYVSPGEEYLITDSWRSLNGRKIDLYISFKKSNHEWSEIKALNTKINTEGFEHIPFVTSDHQYLFFVRDNDFYWVSTKEVFTPYQNLAIPDFYEKVNREIVLKFSDETFLDFNGRIVDYELEVEGQKELPKWIKFSKEDLTLKGTTQKPTRLDCILIAKDNDGNISQAKFEIIIEE